MSAVALRRAGSSGFLAKFIRPTRKVSVTPAASRSFNTSAGARHYDDGDDEHCVEMSRGAGSPAFRRRAGSPSFLSDPFDLFSPTRSVSQLLNMMDRFLESPVVSGDGGLGGAGRAWGVREDENGLHLRMDMPGLAKENVKLSVEQGTLTIRGEGEKEFEGVDSGRKYASRIDIPPNLYRLDQIKAEMKNGVLKVVVPKVKEEERKNVYEVEIE